VSRPSLKIARHDDRQPPGDVTFEVWDPIAARYEPMAALDDGLFRLDDLTERVRLMWVQHDPARTSLKDAPGPADYDDSEWAELRVSSHANRACETRNFDQKGWKKAMSRSVAVETICNEVGCVPPKDVGYSQPAAIALVAFTGSFRTLHNADKFSARGLLRPNSQR
jgi:hypothetical protein